MNKDMLIAKIEKFLAERIESEWGTWPDVAKEDYDELGDIIEHLIDLKWRPDVDDSNVIRFALINRKKAFWVTDPFLKIRRVPDDATPEEEITILLQNLDTLAIATTPDALLSSVRALTYKLQDFNDKIVVWRKPDVKS